MNALRAGRRVGASLTLCALALAFFFIPGLAESLQLERHAIASGQFWQIFTGHFTHWTVEHLTWDLAVFGALAMFCEVISRERFLICIVLSSLVISAGFLWCEPELLTYRGLSGTASALMGLTIVELFRVGWNENRRDAILLSCLGTIVFLTKSAFELTSGHAAFVSLENADFVTVPSAHLLGFLSGLAAGLLSKNQGHHYPKAVAQSMGNSHKKRQA